MTDTHRYISHLSYENRLLPGWCVVGHCPWYPNKIASRSLINRNRVAQVAS